ncbi:hypothetical protein LCM10_12385 [Rossellomorea aquimaris]|uniref:hypothetical protein n=1 Tax=Rossellomorea aquimaris TaxID=189382 RepID=UPI001CD6D4E6|nr:hypothetical protein [Rossellomorea aquimaris]MCA1055786.1 hypothetical protein [Rossellomorea aquimaris]
MNIVPSPYIRIREYIKEGIAISDQKKRENVIKNTSSQANDLVHKAVDSTNDIVKTVSGKGGLVGKATDAASDVIKNVSSTGNDVVGKTVDTSSKVLKNTAKAVFKHKK